MRSGADKRDESVKQGESRGSTTVNERKSFTGCQAESVRSKQEKRNTTVNERKSFTGWPVAGDQVQVRWVNMRMQVDGCGSTTVNERKSFTGCREVGLRRQGNER